MGEGRSKGKGEGRSEGKGEGWSEGKGEGWSEGRGGGRGEKGRVKLCPDANGGMWSERSWGKRGEWRGAIGENNTQEDDILCNQNDFTMSRFRWRGGGMKSKEDGVEN